MSGTYTLVTFRKEVINDFKHTIVDTISTKNSRVVSRTNVSKAHVNDLYDRYRCTRAH